MIIRKEEHETDSPNRVELDVSAAGTEVTVGAGSFALSGIDYELVEDEVHDIGLPAEDTFVNGVLVLDTEAGEVRVLVEQTTALDEPFDFGKYKPLHELYSARVEGGLANLDAVELTVRHLGMAPPKPARELPPKETLRALQKVRRDLRKAAHQAAVKTAKKEKK